MSSRGEPIVCLNMKRQDISFLDQEIFVDPIIIEKEGTTTPTPQTEANGELIGVYFAGNLCLESDLVYRHMTYIAKLPNPGDLVVFVNSAGYFMDFSASTSIMQPVAKKVAVMERNGEFTWMLDENYVPYWECLP